MKELINREITKCSSSHLEVTYPLKTIVLPLDLSPISEAAIPFAASMARLFCSNVIVVHVVEPIIHPIEFVLVPPEMEEVNKKALRLASRKVRQLLRSKLDSTINWRVITRMGKPWKVIVQEAYNLKADLIIIPSHGYHFVKRTLIGSTAERVVQHAHCSVMVLPGGNIKAISSVR